MPLISKHKETYSHQWEQFHTYLGPKQYVFDSSFQYSNYQGLHGLWEYERIFCIECFSIHSNYDKITKTQLHLPYSRTWNLSHIKMSSVTSSSRALLGSKLVFSTHDFKVKAHYTSYTFGQLFVLNFVFFFHNFGFRATFMIEWLFYGQNWTIANLILDLNFHKHLINWWIQSFWIS